MAKIPLTDPVAAWSSRATSDNKIIFRPPHHFRRNFALANEHHAQKKTAIS